MTDTQQGTVHSRGTGDRESHHNLIHGGSYIFSAGASMRRTRPTSRTCGRSTVGLRPILDSSPRCGAP